MAIILTFDKNLVFDGKIIKQGKDTVKEKDRAKGRETEGSYVENGTMQGWTLQIEGDKKDVKPCREKRVSDSGRN